MTATPLDPRVTPFRPDLAAAELAGQVEAARYAEPAPMRVAVGVAGLRGAPAADARFGSELLFGERFDAYEVAGGWAWGQCATDGYVGYVEAAALRPDAEVPAPTHRMTAPRSLLFPGAGIKDPIVDRLSLGALLSVAGETAAPDGTPLLALATGGCVPARHAAPLDAPVADWVEAAQSLTGTPYLWGGRSGLGVDCSGLVQLALAVAGIAAPRDSDQQEAALGARLGDDPAALALRRGDLVFFPGHMGVMLDADTLLHANAHHMAVAAEPLIPALDRIATRAGLRVSSVRRL